MLALFIVFTMFNWVVDESVDPKRRDKVSAFGNLGTTISVELPGFDESATYVSVSSLTS